MFLTLTLPFIQDFSSRETNFYFFQFLSNFLKYSFSNFLSFYPYNIFAIYFSSSLPLLKSCSFTKSNLSCHLTFTLSFLSNFTTTFFALSKSYSLFYISFSTINSFQYTKYFTTSLTFLLFNIFSISYSLTLSTSTGFTFSTLCFFNYSLYLTTQLTFITR